MIFNIQRPSVSNSDVVQLIVFNLQDICILFEVTLNLIMGYYLSFWQFISCFISKIMWEMKLSVMKREICYDLVN